MSTITNRTSPLAERKQLLKIIATCLQEYEPIKDNIHEGEDILALIYLSLERIQLLIKQTLKAWEERNYWVKADQFKEEWTWVEGFIDQYYPELICGNRGQITRINSELSRICNDLRIKPSIKHDKPWKGAHQVLMAKLKHRSKS